MDATRPSVTEFAVLGLLAEAPGHGFALSKELGPEGEVGRILTVHRPLVYRALDRMVEAGFAEAVRTEEGDAGPRRVVHRVTGEGRRALEGWLAEPVEHVRDLRIEFLLKLVLLRRAGRSPLALVLRQRAALAPTLAALRGTDGRRDARADEEGIRKDEGDAAEAGGDTGHDRGDSGSADPVELWRRHVAEAAGTYLEALEARYET